MRASARPDPPARPRPRWHRARPADHPRILGKEKFFYYLRQGGARPGGNPLPLPGPSQPSDCLFFRRFDCGRFHWGRRAADKPPKPGAGVAPCCTGVLYSPSHTSNKKAGRRQIMPSTSRFSMERATGVEPASSAWKAHTPHISNSFILPNSVLLPGISQILRR